MSDLVITDLVLPIVKRKLQDLGLRIPSYAVVRDNTLSNFFEEELSKVLGVCGSKDNCQDLRKAINGAKELDNEKFEELIQKLLERYINLRTTLDSAEKIKPPPDRFKDLRKKAQEVWSEA